MARVYLRACCCAGFILVLAIGCGLPQCNWQNPATWNPIHHQQMAADDQVAASFQQQLSQLKTLAEDAPQMGIDVQLRHVQELVVSVRGEVNPALRSEVVKTLAVFPVIEAEEGLRLAIEDPAADVRIVACEAWSRRGGTEAVRQLTETLNSDTDTDVRLAATRGLARFRNPEVVQSLATAINSNDPALQHAGMQSLQAVTGRDFGHNISAWREFVQGREPRVSAPVIARRYWPWHWF